LWVFGVDAFVTDGLVVGFWGWCFCNGWVSCGFLGLMLL